MRVGVAHVPMRFGRQGVAGAHTYRACPTYRAQAYPRALRTALCYNGRMPKLRADFTTPLNILVTPEMKQLLIAVSYHRGSRGAFGGVTRDMIQAGLDKYINGLSPSERKAFDEILENIKIQAAYQ